MRVSPYPNKLVDHVKTLHESGLGPVKIQRQLGRQGVYVPLDTIRDWIYYRTRLSV